MPSLAVTNLNPASLTAVDAVVMQTVVQQVSVTLKFLIPSFTSCWIKIPCIWRKSDKSFNA
jgi:hypothetical protein